MQKLNDDLDKYTNLLEENQQRISDLETQLDMESEKVSNLLQIDESEKVKFTDNHRLLVFDICQIFNNVARRTIRSKPYGSM